MFEHRREVAVNYRYLCIMWFQSCQLTAGFERYLGKQKFETQTALKAAIKVEQV